MGINLMNKIIEMEFGSRIYGTNLPTSDTDFKAIAVPSKRDIILQRAFRSINLSTGDDKTKNTKDDIDHETFSLHYFLNLLIEGQTVCLDMLFTPDSFLKLTDVKNPNIWHYLQINKDKLLSKKMSAFAGYCQAQAAKYSLKGSNLSGYEVGMNFFKALPIHKRISDVDLTPLIESLSLETIKALNGKNEPLAQIVSIPHKNTGKEEFYIQIGPKTKVPLLAKCGLAAEIFENQYNKYGERAKLAQSNQGVDWKALMHAVRVCQEAIELCKTGNITFPRPEKELLLKIRKGEMQYEEVAEMIEQGLYELNDAKETSHLPSKPDIKWIEDFVVSVYE